MGTCAAPLPLSLPPFSSHTLRGEPNPPLCSCLRQKESHTLSLSTRPPPFLSLTDPERVPATLMHFTHSASVLILFHSTHSYNQYKQFTQPIYTSFIYTQAYINMTTKRKHRRPRQVPYPFNGTCVPVHLSF